MRFDWYQNGEHWGCDASDHGPFCRLCINLTAEVEQMLEAQTVKPPTEYDVNGWVRSIRSWVKPNDADIEAIVLDVRTHPRCRITIEKWDRR